jgi:DNA-binding CsgD family transcriptional regulator
MSSTARPRKRKEDFVEENIDDVLTDQKERMDVPHAGLGIMLLTTSMQLLYKDRRAWELCQQIIPTQDGKTAKGVLPPVVVSLVDQIRKTLRVRTDSKDWDQLQVRRIVDTLHSSVLLSGTALIDQTNAQPRVLIVISEVGIGAWQNHVIVQAKEKFHLTAREATVVQHLFKGFTNKEIANEMRLAEQTIKMYVRHISRKTNATTRTGIVMKIIHSGLRHAQAAPSPHVTMPTMSVLRTELIA